MNHPLYRTQTNFIGLLLDIIEQYLGNAFGPGGVGTYAIKNAFDPNGVGTDAINNALEISGVRALNFRATRTEEPIYTLPYPYQNIPQMITTHLTGFRYLNGSQVDDLLQEYHMPLEGKKLKLLAHYFGIPTHLFPFW